MKSDYKHLKIKKHGNGETHIEHKDGHSLILKHDKLKPEHLKELQHFAEGGSVDYMPQDSRPDTGWGAIIVKRGYADGGEVDLSNIKQNMSDFAANNMAKQDAEMAAAQKQQDAYQQFGADGVIGPQAPEQSASPVAAPQPQSQDWMYQQQPAQQQQNPVQQTIEKAKLGPAEQMMGAFKDERAAIAKQGDLMNQQQQANAKAYEEHQKTMQQIQQDISKNLADISAARQKFMDEANKPLNPNRHWQNLSPAGKTLTVIGLMLGASAGAAGMENPAMKVFEQDIERDLNAQKADRHNKMNLLSALERQYGDQMQASNMYRLMKMDALNNTIAQQAAKYGGPMAQARAQQMIAENKKAEAPIALDLARRQAILGGLRGGTLKEEHAVDAMVPKEHQAKAYEELDKIRAIDKSTAHIENAMKDVEKLQSMGSRVLNPLQSKSQINALNLAVDTAAKEMFGKVSDNEIHLLQSNKVGFADSHETVASKIQNIKSILQKNRHSSLLENNLIMPRAPKQINFKPVK